MLYGERCQLLSHLLLELPDTLHEIRVLLPQPDVLLLQEPPWQAAHLPFGTDVWAGTHNDIHAMLLGETAECRHVVVASEVKGVALRLVDIPEDVYAERVHAERLAHPDAVLPVWARDAWVMNLGRLHRERLAVQEECLLPCRECAALLCSGGA